MSRIVERTDRKVVVRFFGRGNEYVRLRKIVERFAETRGYGKKQTFEFKTTIHEVLKNSLEHRAYGSVTLSFEELDDGRIQIISLNNILCCLIERLRENEYDCSDEGILISFIGEDGARLNPNKSNGFGLYLLKGYDYDIVHTLFCQDNTCYIRGRFTSPLKEVT